MGVSALKTVFRNIETHGEINEKLLKNNNLRIMFFVNISEHSQYFRNRLFAKGSFLN